MSTLLTPMSTSSTFPLGHTYTGGGGGVTHVNACHRIPKMPGKGGDGGRGRHVRRPCLLGCEVTRPTMAHVHYIKQENTQALKLTAQQEPHRFLPKKQSSSIKQTKKQDKTNAHTCTRVTTPSNPFARTTSLALTTMSLRSTPITLRAPARAAKQLSTPVPHPTSSTTCGKETQAAGMFFRGDRTRIDDNGLLFSTIDSDLLT